MSSATGPSSSTSGRKIAAIVLAVVAVLFIIAGIVFAASGHHALRTAGSFIVGLVFAAGAWVALAYKPKAQDAPQNNVENTPAGHN